MRALLVLLLLAALPSAGAHVVSGNGGGASLDYAAWLPGVPTRVFEAAPDEEGGHYYAIDLRAGEPVRLRLAAPDGGGPAFLLIAGPGLPTDTPEPPGLATPDEGGHVFVFPQDGPRTAIDPWIPAQFRVTLDETFTPPEGGRYHLIVPVREETGRFALLVEPPDGRGLADWMTMYQTRAAFRAWEGEPVWQPFLLGALAGAVVLAPFAPRLRRMTSWPVPRVAAVGAAALLAASAGVALPGAMAILRGAPLREAAAVLLPVVVPLGLALVALALAARPRVAGIGPRAALLAAAALAFLTFSGFLWGGIALAVAGVMPDDPPRDAGTAENDGVPGGRPPGGT